MTRIPRTHGAALREPAPTLGARVAQRRLELGLTQEAAAARAGLSRAMVASIELGLRTGKPPVLRRLARALELEYMELAALAGMVDAGTGEATIRVPRRRAAHLAMLAALPAAQWQVVERVSAAVVAGLRDCAGTAPPDRPPPTD